MKRVRSHFCAAFAGALIVTWLPSPFRSGPPLTRQQSDVLRCLELVYLPDGQGDDVPTLRVRG